MLNLDHPFVASTVAAKNEQVGSLLVFTLFLAEVYERGEQERFPLIVDSDVISSLSDALALCKEVEWLGL